MQSVKIFLCSLLETTIIKFFYNRIHRWATLFLLFLSFIERNNTHIVSLSQGKAFFSCDDRDYHLIELCINNPSFFAARFRVLSKHEKYKSDISLSFLSIRAEAK